jgi:hypothetical protein
LFFIGIWNLHIFIGVCDQFSVMLISFFISVLFLFGPNPAVRYNSSVYPLFFLPQKELPLVALLGQEKIGFSPAGFSLPSGTVF